MRTLLIHPGYLGVTVFLGPAVRALKAQWPNGQVALCVSPRGADVAALLPGCDQVFVIDKRGDDAGYWGALRVGKTLRGFRPDVALVSHYSIRAGALAWLSHAPRRIGYAPLFCTEKLKLDRSGTFVQRSLRLADRAGAKSVDETLHLRVPPDLTYADERLAGRRKPIVALVPGAEWETKRWGTTRYAELSKALVERGATVLLLGGPNEKAVAAELATLEPRAIDLVGNTIAESLAVLARCDAVVGGDTGLVHCARALGRKTVALFGPTDPRRHQFGSREVMMTLGLECQPCHDHGPRQCPLGHHRCMVDLMVPDVALRTTALLDAQTP